MWSSPPRSTKRLAWWKHPASWTCTSSSSCTVTSPARLPRCCLQRAPPLPSSPPLSPARPACGWAGRGTHSHIKWGFTSPEKSPGVGAGTVPHLSTVGEVLASCPHSSGSRSGPGLSVVGKIVQPIGTGFTDDGLTIGINFIRSVQVYLVDKSHIFEFVKVEWMFGS